MKKRILLTCESSFPSEFVNLIAFWKSTLNSQSHLQLHQNNLRNGRQPFGIVLSLLVCALYLSFYFFFYQCFVVSFNITSSIDIDLDEYCQRRGVLEKEKKMDRRSQKRSRLKIPTIPFTHRIF